MVPSIHGFLRKVVVTCIILALAGMAGRVAMGGSISSPLVLEASDNLTRVTLTTPKKVSFTLTFPANDRCGVVLKGLSISAPIQVPTPDDRFLRSVKVANSKEGIMITLDLRSPWVRVIPRWLTQPTRIELSIEKLPPKEEFWMKALSAYHNKNYAKVLGLLYSTSLGKLSRSKQVAALVMLVDALYHTGRYQEATKVATRFLDKVKHDFRREKVWELKIKADEKAGLYQLLLADVNSLSKEFPDSPFIPFAIVMKARVLLLHLAREKEAIIMLKDLIAKLPQTHPATYRAKALLGLAYYLKKNYLASYMLLTLVKQDRPDVVNTNTQYLFALGRSAFMLHKYEDAKKSLQRVFNVYPDSPEAPKALALTGDIFLTQKNLKIAQWIFDTCNRLYPDTKAGAIAKLRLAYIAYQKGDLKKALSIFGDASFLYPQYPEVTEFAALRKAEILLELKRYNDAILAVQDFISRFPSSRYGRRISLVMQKAKLALAERELKRKRYLDAVMAFNDFITSFPNSPLLDRAKKMMGDSLLRAIVHLKKRGDCANTIVYWERFGRKYMPILGLQGIPYYYVGKCYQKREELDQAIGVFEKLRTRLGPKFKMIEDLRNSLAMAYDSKELFGKAAPLMWKNTKAKEPFRKKAYTWLLDYSFVLGQEKTHKELAQSFAKLYPTDSRIIYDIYRQGLMAMEKGRNKEAMGWFRAVVEQYRKLPNLITEQAGTIEQSWIILGKDKWLKGKDKEALKLLTTVASIWPKHKSTAEALFLAGSSAKRLKKYTLSKMLWDRCKREFPKSYWSREIEIRRYLAIWKKDWAKEIPGK